MHTWFIIVLSLVLFVLYAIVDQYFLSNILVTNRVSESRKVAKIEQLSVEKQYKAETTCNYGTLLHLCASA